FALAKRLKLAKPEIVTVIGGAAVDGKLGQEFSRQVEQMDYIFSGPGLMSFSTFVENLLNDDHEANEGIHGVFSKTNEDRWQDEKPKGELFKFQANGKSVAMMGEDFDIDADIPLDYGPFLDAFETVFPDGGLKPVLLFETSRGCWWAEKSVCTFCGLNGVRQVQHWMKPDMALKHIESLFQWVPRCSSFIAVDTIIPPPYIKDVFPRLKPPPEMKMLYELRAVIGEEDVEVLNRAGVAAFQPGIEALSTSTLKLMAKGTTVFQNLLFLKICSRHPVSLDWNLLICSPGEPEETFEKYRRDLPLLMHLAPPSGVYPISFVRYSRYFDNAESFGLDLEPQDFYRLTYPFEARAGENIAY
ncbi:MAG: RiPP maturation radical SAM C-methyltransferase, partial [Verrucomicrobiota bacterium]